LNAAIQQTMTKSGTNDSCAIAMIGKTSKRDVRQLDLASSIPFFLIHVAVVAVLWTGYSRTALIVCLATYAVRMFGITAGFHRYFSHRSYKTGRIFQFMLAWAGASSAQKGVLWWAAHHRHHHANSDKEADVHSPVQRGFRWSHVGWFLCNEFDDTRVDLISDLVRFPELRFLNRWHALPPFVLAGALLLLGSGLNRFHPDLGTSGAQMLVWGFCISTVAVYHATFSVNSLAHVFGTRTFSTTDDSRNNPIVAFFTFGEGWHNNHHFSPSLECQGLEWWEIDITHYILRLLSFAGLVWDLRTRSPLRTTQQSMYQNCIKTPSEQTLGDPESAKAASRSCQ